MSEVPLYVSCFYMVYRQSPLDPVDPAFRALSGRLQFTVRRHKFNEDSLSCAGRAGVERRRSADGQNKGVPRSQETYSCGWPAYRGTSLIRNSIQRYLAHKKQHTGVPRS